MKKNLFFLALIFLLVGAGCEEVGKLSGDDSENLEKIIMDNGLLEDESGDQDVTNTEKMEVEDSEKEKSAETKKEIKPVEKKSLEKMEIEDEDEDEDNEFEDEDGEDDDKTPAQVTTPAPVTPKPTTPTTPTTPTVKSYTMVEVKAANSAQKCWTAVSGKVYDLTPALTQHPGGKAAIMSLCGIDGTSAFTNQHGGQSNPMSMLNGLQIGILK